MGSGDAPSDESAVGWAKDASACERPCLPTMVRDDGWWARPLRGLSPPYGTISFSERRPQ